MNVLVGVVMSRIKFITCGQSESRTVSGRMELHSAPVVFYWTKALKSVTV